MRTSLLLLGLAALLASADARALQSELHGASRQLQGKSISVNFEKTLPPLLSKGKPAAPEEAPPAEAPPEEAPAPEEAPPPAEAPAPPPPAPSKLAQLLAPVLSKFAKPAPAPEEAPAPAPEEAAPPAKEEAPAPKAEKAAPAQKEVIVLVPVEKGKKYVVAGR